MEIIGIPHGGGWFNSTNARQQRSQNNVINNNGFLKIHETLTTQIGEVKYSFDDIISKITNTSLRHEKNIREFNDTYTNYHKASNLTIPELVLVRNKLVEINKRYDDVRNV